MATQSSDLAWRIPWTEKPGGLQPMGSQRVRHNWVRTQKLCLWCSQISPYVSHHLTGPGFYNLEKNDNHKYSAFLSSVSYLVNDWTWEGYGTSQLVTSWSRSAGGLGTPELAAGVCSEGSLGKGCALNLWSLTQLQVAGVCSGLYLTASSRLTVVSGTR